MQCSVALNDGLKSVAGNALTGPREFRFETGGPFVSSVMPGGGEIEEDQIVRAAPERPRHGSVRAAKYLVRIERAG